MNTANREELSGELPLTDAELRDVIKALAPSWKHGHSFRNWAISRGYIQKEDC
jgi:hypothetical protein